MSEWKPTNNPKDSLGTAKAPLHLVPASMEVAASMAFLEGREKYGQYNWRVTGVRASVYYAALMRHMKAWWDGRDIDPDSGLPELWKALACLAILVDAGQIEGCLLDDRPPVAPTAEMIDATKATGDQIRERLADYEPYQYSEKNRHDGPQSDPGPKKAEVPVELLEAGWRSVMQKRAEYRCPLVACADRTCTETCTFVDQIDSRTVEYRCPVHGVFRLHFSGDLQMSPAD